MKSYKEIRKTIREMHGASEPYGVFAGRGRVGPQDGDNADGTRFAYGQPIIMRYYPSVRNKRL